MRHVKEALSKNRLNNHPSAEPEAMTESRGAGSSVESPRIGGDAPVELVEDWAAP